MPEPAKVDGSRCGGGCCSGTGEHRGREGVLCFSFKSHMKIFLIAKLLSLIYFRRSAYTEICLRAKTRAMAQLVLSCCAQMWALLKDQPRGNCFGWSCMLSAVPVSNHEPFEGFVSLLFQTLMRCPVKSLQVWLVFLCVRAAWEVRKI